MKIIVLGAAAGGGFPQWNCNCDNCRRVRLGDSDLKPRTQSSLAVSADGERWLVMNASPDIRQQIFDNHQLHPRSGRRHSPIGAVALTNADVDHTAGLLTLRESQPFNLYATNRILEVLSANRIFDVLNPEFVKRNPLQTNATTELLDQLDKALGLTISAFPIPGKVALYLEDEQQENYGSVPEDTIGLKISSTTNDRSFFYLPGCAAMTPELCELVKNAELVFMDGTTWVDDEMSQQGVGEKTAQRMGHMPISGDNGTIRAFDSLGVKRKVFVHINNTNPILDESSDAYRQALAAGWTVATDGLELSI